MPVTDLYDFETETKFPATDDRSITERVVVGVISTPFVVAIEAYDAYRAWMNPRDVGPGASRFVLGVAGFKDAIRERQTWSQVNESFQAIPEYLKSQGFHLDDGQLARLMFGNTVESEPEAPSLQADCSPSSHDIDTGSFSATGAVQSLAGAVNRMRGRFNDFADAGPPAVQFEHSGRASHSSVGLQSQFPHGYSVDGEAMLPGEGVPR